MKLLQKFDTAFFWRHSVLRSYHISYQDYRSKSHRIASRE